MTTKSCLTAVGGSDPCPSLLTADQAKRELKYDYGPDVLVCATRGQPIGIAGATEAVMRDIAEYYATSCPNYGVPVVIGELRPKQKTSDPVCLPPPPDVPDKGVADRVTNCQGCANFIPEQTVSSSFGWAQPMCGAKGILLPPQRWGPEAKHCPHAKPATDYPGVDPATLSPLSHYTGGVIKFGVAAAPSAAAAPIDLPAKATREPEADPSTITSFDMPASPEHAAKGVRGWLKIVNPDNKDLFIHYPVFNPDVFDEEARREVPQTGYPKHPELYVDEQNLFYKIVAASYGLDKTPLLEGGAGTGKTEAFQYAAWKMQLPFIRLQMTNSTEVDDLVGKTQLVEAPNGGVITKFELGRLPKWWVQPCVMVTDEFNTAQYEVEQLYRPLMDSAQELFVDQADGAGYKKDPFNLFGIAQNPAWDIRYAGTLEPSAALKSRVSTVSVGNPSEKVEREILIMRCQAGGYQIKSGVINTIMKISDNIRSITMGENATLMANWGVRENLAVAAATQYFTLTQAYKLAIADGLSPQEASIILDIVKGYVT